MWECLGTRLDTTYTHAGQCFQLPVYLKAISLSYMYQSSSAGWAEYIIVTCSLYWSVVILHGGGGGGGGYMYMYKAC